MEEANAKCVIYLRLKRALTSEMRIMMVLYCITSWEKNPSIESCRPANPMIAKLSFPSNDPCPIVKTSAKNSYTRPSKCLATGPSSTLSTSLSGSFQAMITSQSNCIQIVIGVSFPNLALRLFRRPVACPVAKAICLRFNIPSPPPRPPCPCLPL